MATSCEIDQNRHCRTNDGIPNTRFAIVGVQPITDSNSIPSQTDILVDAGLAPLVNRQHLIPEFRLYLIFHEINKTEHSGRGWLTRLECWQGLARFGVKYTHREFDYLINSGEGIFWHVNQDGSRINLAAYERIWHRLLKRLYRQGVDRSELNDYRVTPYKVRMPASGTLQAFKARLYSAWITTRTNKEKLQASRDFIGRVWGVCANTLRQWEAVAGVNVTPNYAQYVGNNPRFKIPDHAYIYAKKDGNIAPTWQISNTYTSGVSIERHNCKGQYSRAKKARNRFLKIDQPIQKSGDGLAASGKRYFESEKSPDHAFKALHKYLRKKSPDLSILRYVALGTKKTRRGKASIFECYDVEWDYRQTELNERDYSGEQTPKFKQLAYAAQEFGITRNLLKHRWRDEKKTEHTCVVNGDVIGAGVQPLAQLEAFIFADAVLSLAHLLGAHITQISSHRQFKRQSSFDVVQHGLALNRGSVIVLKSDLRIQVQTLQRSKALSRKKAACFHTSIDAAGLDRTQLQAIQSDITRIRLDRQQW